MKVLVCGSRKWVDQAPIERELRKLPKGTIIVHGACRGADNIAGYIAKVVLKLEVRPYPADWDFYGPAAGVLRNQRMLDEEHPDPQGVYFDKVLAFDKGGSGTADMLTRAGNADPSIDIEVFAA